MIGVVKRVMPIMCLSFHITSYGTVAYIPQALKECIGVVHEMVGNINNEGCLQELCAAIKENRVLAAESTVRGAIKETFDILNKHQKIVKNKNQVRLIKRYLKKYVDNLDNISVVCALHGAESQHTSCQISSVARSLSPLSHDIDMMCLSSMLTSAGSIQLCGNADIDYSMFAINNKPNRLFDHHVFFNPNMMTNISHSTPNIILGTGVASPIINAWAMSPSNMIQSPINMQLSIPGALFFENAEALDLHFLIKKQGAVNHKARVEVDVKYMGKNDKFDILSPTPTFSYEAESNDFNVFEPSLSDDIRHICVTIPLQKSCISNCNFIFLSLTRIAPLVGVEYDQDIYLAAAIFRYKSI